MKKSYQIGYNAFMTIFALLSFAITEAQNWTQIQGQTNALITDIISYKDTIRVAGNYTQVNLNGNDYIVNRYSEIVNNIWTITPKNLPVNDGKLCVISNTIYLLGNDGSQGKIYKMQSGIWTNVYNFNGKIYDCDHVGSFIAVGGAFSGYFGFYNIASNTFNVIQMQKPVEQIAGNDTYTLVRYSYSDQITELGKIIENSTQSVSSIDFPAGMAIIKGIGASKHQLYVSGISGNGDRTYVLNGGTWITFTTHDDNSSSGYFAKFWFDETSNTLYADNRGAYVNGQRFGRLATYDMTSSSWVDLDSNRTLPGLQGMIFQSGNVYVNTGLNVYAKFGNVTGIKNNQQKVAVKVYPNPTNGYIKLQSDVEIELPLLSISGQVLQTVRLKKYIETTIDISNLPAGTYFIGGQEICKL